MAYRLGNGKRFILHHASCILHRDDQVRVGVFGGTFNPIHFGHLRAAEEVKEKLNLDKVLFIPAGKPPLKTGDIEDGKHRYEMIKRAIRGNPSFELSDIEFRKKGKSYTVKTIEELRRSSPEKEFFFIVGIDAFLDIPDWWQPDRLVSLTHFIIISRPGFLFSELRMSPYLKTSRKILRDFDRLKTEIYRAKLQNNRDAILLKLTPLGISATGIRRLICQGKSIKYLLPPEVHSYIITNKLYMRKA